jgi:hypothetical protein
VEWLVLVVWVLVFALAMPLGAGVFIGRISFGVQAMAAVAGLALLVIYLFVGQPSSLAWAATAAGAVGTLAVAIGVAGLVSDREPAVVTSRWTGEVEALLAGAALPLFIVVALLTTLVALGIGTST